MAASTKDAVLSSAVDRARAAAEEVADSPDLVGEHVGVVVVGERLVAHRFASTALGYRGWEWTVTLARVPRGRTPTVCEVDLLPGDDAILAPAWVPWAERVRPGDLGPTDVLPYLPFDERLEEGYRATGAEDADRLAVEELGLGRARVLSRQGRTEAAQRWYTGSHGPMTPGAIAASAPCSTCGFLVLLAGSLRTTFGVCANEWSPDDGKVVSMDHGCGAHSQTDVIDQPSEWPDRAPLLDDADVEVLPNERGEQSTVDEPTDDGASVDEPTDGASVDEPTDDGASVEPAVVDPAAEEAAPEEAAPEMAPPAQAEAEPGTPSADEEPSQE